ncbi:MAG: Coatomer subunit gamma-2 [Watsoniomyces obsoletus]|nr:MAG: Coatomer subunit gamma-2 [Watsoniomyces obsoletus]
MEYPYFGNTSAPYTGTSSGVSPPIIGQAPMGHVGESYDRPPQVPQQPYGAYGPYPSYGPSSASAEFPMSMVQHPGSITRTHSTGPDPEQDRHSSSDEREPLTPAQARRKAQNRAAQRAFRERKERHVKDLEQRVTTLEQASSSLAADNDRLRRALDQATSENQRLRASASANANTLGAGSSHVNVLTASTQQMRTSPAAFYNTMPGHPQHPTSHRVTTVTSRTREHLVGASAAWDLIHSHPLTIQGLVDVAAVAERLKQKTHCDGTGPAFEERDVMAAIESSVVPNQDALG